MPPRKKLTQGERDRRATKRERRAAERGVAEASSAAETPVVDLRPTFGEAIESASLRRKISTVQREMIARTGPEADKAAKLMLKVVSCHNCTAPKGCCTLSVGVFMYEAVPIAARLRHEGRDTPELRAELLAAARLMESTSPSDYRRPCAFLDENERCTIYEDRPSECGMAFVFSDPIRCSDPEASSIDKFVAPFVEFPPQFEAKFEQDARLPRLRGPYMGALPRMVLLCLEAWDRRDYADFFMREVPLAAERYIGASAADVLQAPRRVTLAVKR